MSGWHLPSLGGVVFAANGFLNIAPLLRIFTADASHVHDGLAGGVGEPKPGETTTQANDETAATRVNRIAARRTFV
jgi:hypothetical protein